MHGRVRNLDAIRFEIHKLTQKRTILFLFSHLKQFLSRTTIFFVIFRHQQLLSILLVTSAKRGTRFESQHVTVL